MLWENYPCLFKFQLGYTSLINYPKNHCYKHMTCLVPIYASSVNSYIDLLNHFSRELIIFGRYEQRPYYENIRRTVYKHLIVFMTLGIFILQM